jgi:hypothetical protein
MLASDVCQTMWTVRDSAMLACRTTLPQALRGRAHYLLDLDLRETPPSDMLHVSGTSRAPAALLIRDGTHPGACSLFLQYIVLLPSFHDAVPSAAVVCPVMLWMLAGS